MDLLSIGIFVLLVIGAFILARFVLHLAWRAVGCVLTVIVALGILYLLLQIF